jgi:molybdopterin-guanine dinucleotide biosynthesis protein A
MTVAPRATDVTLGVLAGGQGSRLGGIDKAWIMRDGVSQVARLVRRFEGEVDAVLVSANRDLPCYETIGLRAIPDRIAHLGPLGGLDALAAACTTPWLLTLPVDLVFVNDCLLPTLASAGGQGASIEDDDGPQPLVALWRVDALRTSLSFLRNQGFRQTKVCPSTDPADLSVQSLQQSLQMPRIRLRGVRLGNLNTPADLAAVHATIG